MLTWLVIGAIVQIEQRKRDKRNKEKFRRSKNPMLNENNTSVTPNVQTIKTITEIISCFVGYVFLKKIRKNRVDVLN